MKKLATTIVLLATLEHGGAATQLSQAPTVARHRIDASRLATGHGESRRIP